MSYTSQQWKKRFQSRMDIFTQVTHLTRTATIDGVEISPLDVIIKILRERKILGSTTQSGFIVGDTPAVCFIEAPLYSICENIDFEKSLKEEQGRDKERYSPFGLMFHKTYIYKCGGLPVIYDNSSRAKKYLPESEWWRIVHFDLSDPENYVDWTHEREWRLSGDFTFDIEEATVLVPNKIQFKDYFEKASKDGEDVSMKISCIVPLGSLYV